MSVSAMKQALEALEEVQRYDKTSEWFEKKVSALRQAIEQAEKQEPAFYVIQATDRFGEGYEQTYWEDPAGFPVYTRPVVHEVRCTYPQCQATNGCAGACSKGQSEKQEPVAQAWDEGYRTGINDERMSEANIGIAGFGAKVEPARNNPYRTTPPAQAPVHASDISQERVDETAKNRHGACVTCGALVEDQIIKQPKREWVDLTQEEVEEIYKETQDEFQFSQLLAYKLREKNSEWNGKGWA